MDTLGDRLLVVMQELGISSPKALADYCNVSEGLVSQWFSGRTKLGPKPLKAFSKTHFSLDWITSGKLPKYRKDDAARRLLAVPPVPPKESDVVTADEILELISAYKDSKKKDRDSVMNLAKTSAEKARRQHADATGNKGQ